MSWRETWRATVESFLREVREPGSAGQDALPGDAVYAAIAGARAEVRQLEEDLAETRLRVDAEAESVAVCDRRRDQAERIGDADTARVADRFGRRHADRLAVLQRKCAVLEEELALARTTLSELLDIARAETDEVRESAERR